MKSFQDAATGKNYSFEDDVIVIETNGVYAFYTNLGTISKPIEGVLLNVPTTLQPYTPPTPTAAELLAEAQTAQIGKLYGSPADPPNTSYQSAIVQPVSFTSAGGVTKTYQADAVSVADLAKMINAFSGAGAVPKGFYWVAEDNTQVPFTLADLQGLAEAMGNQGWAAFQNLQTKKAAVMAATTVSAVQAVTW